MKKYITLILSLFFATSIFCQNVDTAIINLSRRSSLKIIAYDKSGDGSVGTGFFVKVQGDVFVLTCLHVTSKIIATPTRVDIINFDNIRGITWNGDTINLSHVPIEKDKVFGLDNLVRDFEILKTKKLPKGISTLSISQNSNEIFPGETIYFSGYPIDLPLLSHTGLISGTDIDTSGIYIQSAINNGNSGGALLNSKGNVIGMINKKFYKPFMDFDNFLKDLEKPNTGTVSFGQLDKDGKVIISGGTDFNYDLVKTLKSSLNTGIGGATNIKYVRKYLH